MDGANGHGCRWPLWANGAPSNGRYCGQPVCKPGASYCEVHTAKAKGRREYGVEFKPRKVSGITLRRG